MAETVTMPKLGFDMAEGTVVRWVVPEGEQVEKGAILAEIETDKATVEVESPYAGTVRKYLVNEGDVVPIGTPIAVIGSPDEPITVEEQAAKPEAKEAEPAEPVSAQPKETPTAQAPEPAVEFPMAEEPGLPGGVRASPVARHMAEEQGINLRQVQGTGPNGRITKSDVEDYLKKAPAPAAQPTPTAPAPAPTPQPAPAQAARQSAAPLPLPSYAPSQPTPENKEIPLSRLRNAVGRRMVQSKQQVPHFYVTHEYNMGPVRELRTQINQLLGEGEKISVNDFIVKAVALTLRSFPNVNAALQGDKIVQYGQINIGVAVSVEGGLLTVVCQNADRKPLRQISLEVRQMAERARQGKVRPDDVEGSTFSISNLGMYDVENFLAIINPPEAAILAVGSAQEVPVVVNGQLEAGFRMKATISIDHRVSDGAEAARFLQMLARYLEEPMRLLL